MLFYFYKKLSEFEINAKITHVRLHINAYCKNLSGGGRKNGYAEFVYPKIQTIKKEKKKAPIYVKLHRIAFHVTGSR